MDNSKEFQTMLDEAVRVEPDGFKDFDRTKNVQDQLQGMLEEVEPYWGVLLHFINKFCLNTEIDKTRLTSMEQLWLAFCMAEKFSKKWGGTEWVALDK